MSDTPQPPPWPVNPYQPSHGVVTDASGFAVAGSTVPPGAIEALRQTRPWVLFLAVLGAIFTGFMLLASLGMMAGGAFIPATVTRPDGSETAIPFGGPAFFIAFGILYLIFTALYLYPVVKLFKYAGAIRALTLSGAPADLENALRQQKSFWKFTGIMVIVGMLAYVVIFVFMIAAGGFAAMSNRQPTVIEQTTP